MEAQQRNWIDEPREIGLTLADVLRSSDVNRWQIVRTSRHQSVAEHTFNVMLIALDIADSMGIEDQPSIMKCALMHDLPEVLTGDVATPTKRVLDIGDRLEQIEALISYRGIKTQDYGDLIRHIVKMADLVEAAHFLHHFGIGPHAQSVLDQITGRLNKFPEARAAFARALDATPTTIDGAYGAT